MVNMVKKLRLRMHPNISAIHKNRSLDMQTTAGWSGQLKAKDPSAAPVPPSLITHAGLNCSSLKVGHAENSEQRQETETASMSCRHVDAQGIITVR